MKESPTREAAVTTQTAPVRAKTPSRPADRIFASSTVIAGVLILVALASVALVLIAQSIPALTADPAQLPTPSSSFWEYVAPLAFGTVWAAILALIIALPLSLGIALFISHYAPRKVAQSLGYIIDLLAAVPSVVFGLWGIKVFAPFVQPFYMVVPIITAVCREVFLQTPVLHEEAALALGATRWEMIRMTVLPFGMPGIISATMLGLGRALGETLVVAMVLSPALVINFVLTGSANPPTIAGNIALNFPEAHGLGVNALIATGLILFIITLLVNLAARVVINRRKAFSGAN